MTTYLISVVIVPTQKDKLKKMKITNRKQTYTKAHSSNCSTETPRSSVQTHRCSSGCLHLHSAAGSTRPATEMLSF